MTFGEYEQLTKIINQMNIEQLKELNDFISGKDGTQIIVNEFSGDDLLNELRFTPINYLQYLTMTYEERKKVNDFHLEFEHDPIHFKHHQIVFRDFVKWVNTKHKND